MTGGTRHNGSRSGASCASGSHDSSVHAFRGCAEQAASDGRGLATVIVVGGVLLIGGAVWCGVVLISGEGSCLASDESKRMHFDERHMCSAFKWCVLVACCVFLFFSPLVFHSWQVNKPRIV